MKITVILAGTQEELRAALATGFFMTSTMSEYEDDEQQSEAKPGTVLSLVPPSSADVTTDAHKEEDPS